MANIIKVSKETFEKQYSEFLQNNGINSFDLSTKTLEKFAKDIYRMDKGVFWYDANNKKATFGIKY